MSGLSHTTKAELASELAETHVLLKQERDRAAKARETFDTEARVIDACVRALDNLPKPRTTSYGSSTGPSSSAVLRILTYLRIRYGLPDPSAEMEQLRRDYELQLQRADRACEALEMVREQVAEVPA